MTSALRSGRARCPECELVCRRRPVPRGHEARCPRCWSRVHARKPDSLARTSALLVAAAILYVPANLLPVTTVVWLGRGDPDTILSSVRALFAGGDAPVALLLFFASICVPVLKIVLLGWLVASVRWRWLWRPRDRTSVYRVVDVIGRWSMLDVFVISILVALVQLGALASIDAGPGAVSFCAVVVLTMLAAHSFDPRLIWDAAEEHEA